MKCITVAIAKFDLCGKIHESGLTFYLGAAALVVLVIARIF